MNGYKPQKDSRNLDNINTENFNLDLSNKPILYRGLERLNGGWCHPNIDGKPFTLDDNDWVSSHSHPNECKDNINNNKETIAQQIFSSWSFC